jgi:hypothetical protein
MPISLSGSLVLTGSITTTGGITISGSILSASYSATSSFSNDFTVLGNLTVFGTQSVQYITSSQLNVSDNVITVNVASPGVRFGGLSVFDSGSLSSEATASLFWDSQQNHWIYQRESGSTYDGGMIMSGPRNSSGLGNEQGTTACRLLVGQGGDHLTSSLVYHDSTKTCFYGNSFISSSGIACFSSTVCANIITGATVSAGVPTNSRIVANANQMYGYYDVEANYRWSLGRDVWTGGSAGLAFGVGGTTTCYAMIGDPSGFGCTIAFATLVPNGCSGTTYEKMRITSLGNVGIGTTSPKSYSSLTTSGQIIALNNIGIDAGQSFRFNNYYNSGTVTDRTISTGYAASVGLDNSVGALTFNTSLTCISADNNVTVSERMRITNCGNIGINFPIPTFPLTRSGITIKAATNDGVEFVMLSCADTGFIGGVLVRNGVDFGIVNRTNGNLIFATNAVERMYIINNGFMGVATTSPKAVFDVGYGNAHSIISTWCKAANNGTMYNGFDIIMDESSFSGQLYVQANGGGIGIQATYDVLASYDRLCVIPRNSMNRGNSESLTIPSYFFQAGSKRICIQQNNGAGAQMNISAMLVGTAYGGNYICAQA